MKLKTYENRANAAAKTLCGLSLKEMDHGFSLKAAMAFQVTPEQAAKEIVNAMVRPSDTRPNWMAPRWAGIAEVTYMA